MKRRTEIQPAYYLEDDTVVHWAGKEGRLWSTGCGLRSTAGLGVDSWAPLESRLWTAEELRRSPPVDAQGIEKPHCPRCGDYRKRLMLSNGWELSFFRTEGGPFKGVAT